MTFSTSLRRISAPILLAFVLSATSKAQTVLDVTTALTLADSTQLGRLSRNAIPQDWADTELFPGVINTTTTYHYRTFVIDPFTASLGPFMQITIDDQGPTQGNLFASAFFTSYAPDSSGTPNFGFDTHWLGDAGSSGNFFGGTDPAFFQVVVPTGTSLVVVVANAGAANGGVGEKFNLLVESFSDSSFDPPAIAPSPTPPPLTAVPEPSAYGAMGAAMIAGLSFWRRGCKRRMKTLVAG